MTIEPFRKEDVPRFLRLAAAENWVAEPWEFDFLLSTFPDGCLSARDEAGAAVGFVTSLRHDCSGWIGNLIVDRDCRGTGIGEALFLGAFDSLRAAGAETFWLTASKMGKALYEKHGFNSTDTIIRWTGRTGAPTDTAPAAAGAWDAALDRLGWGDRRDGLLAATCRRGTVLAADSAFAVIQPCGQAVQLGPFGAVSPDRAARLLDEALSSLPAGVTVYIDTPACNSGAVALLQERGFRDHGTNVLMYAGVKPDYRPEYIYGLATMGSCG
ncbi:GNAT family N-acetyltransferase [Oryzomonas sagensis]|uniref:GNAT family N-acetyltransferase n=1 Tax=Oryzomonas sagensis TaxID=2603857 RepID=A0ABQ6TS83_9BACT|nr:GNAT family N-acetyltransferase [Oryzomonas sagensis]KAB0671854.1 GNAT family N-acetyltransferase [Oryzomonas sagensis]